MTQNTPIYTLPGEGKKHTWIFWNKTGEPIYDLWIKTGVGVPDPLPVGTVSKAKPPLIKKIVMSKVVEGKRQVLRKIKVERKTMVKLFGSHALRMDSIIGVEDRDAFLSFVRSNKENREIKQVLDDIGTHLWTLWEWIGEYTKDKGTGQLAKPEELFTVAIEFARNFESGQWIEFIPIDIHGFTINSSNRPDERTVMKKGIVPVPKPVKKRKGG